jgi:uncharacterized protein (TIGR03437 family)
MAVPSGQHIVSVAHAPTANRVVVLPFSDASNTGATAPASEIDLFSYDFLALSGRLLIPNVGAAGKSFVNHGRFVFVANDGTTLVTILQADGAAGFLNDYSILTSSLSGSVVNSANFWIAASAADQIATIFGSNLASGSASATSLPLPSNLAGAQVTITPNGGGPIKASLFYASPSQINFLIPPIPAGKAELAITVNGQVVVDTVLTTQPTAPGLYSANGDGQGVAAAQASVNQTNGQALTLSTFQFNTQSRAYATNPLPYTSAGTSSIYLVLYGTGFRNATHPVTATLAGIAVPVTYAGAQGTNVGLDQINIGPLPKGLDTYSDLPLVINADGTASNAVTVRLQ